MTLLYHISTRPKGRDIALVLAINCQLQRRTRLPTPLVQFRPLILVADADTGHAAHGKFSALLSNALQDMA
jgi:hypothetical protein